MLVILHGFGVLSQVKICISQLRVDGTKSPQVIGSSLDGCFEESHTSPGRKREAAVKIAINDNNN